MKPLSTGIPQGSTLGPLLFLTCINDLSDCLDSTTPGMYADDTQIITAKTGTVAELEHLLNLDVMLKT